MHKDKLGQVIYVGKAVSLKNRVRQYFRASGKADMKVRSMVSHIAEFEYITCGTEMEALILECNLIKKYKPKYNVVLRDDKTYPYIKMTVNEAYPRIFKTRRLEKDNSRYFGPYADVAAVNAAIDMLNEIFKLKCCAAKKFPANSKPCLNYHIGRCRGVCTGNVDKAEYGKAVGQVAEILSGRNKTAMEQLKSEMEKAADELNFEKAAQLRDHIEAVKSLGEKQRVSLLGLPDTDMVLTLSSEKSQYVVLFFVREGKLSGRESYPLFAGEGEKARDIAAAFIKQYYTDSAVIPKELIVMEEMQESALLEAYLEKLSGHGVKITVPRRGDKKALLDLAKKDVDEMAKSIDEKARMQREIKHALGAELHKILSGGEGGYSEGEYRIESYDISNTNGVDTVGGMVVFEGAAPKRKDYRRFKVRTVSGADDYGSLREVVYRRFARAQAGDPGFSRLPDLLLIDGGKNQVSAVEAVLGAMKINIPVLGMVKDEHHRTRGLVYSGEETDLKCNPVLYKYIGTIQEETHRFAIEYHRGLRDKKMRSSALDNIEGVGAKRRNALLAHFGSIESIKNASADELCQVKGMTKAVANNIIEYFN
ncbi:MAG: excinuclease ABC subunit UvrC [Clostridiales bacterium]|nr:excinuclease ABC subunit UvrC [Clostridiales bacterium]